MDNEAFGSNNFLDNLMNLFLGAHFGPAHDLHTGALELYDGRLEYPLGCLACTIRDHKDAIHFPLPALPPKYSPSQHP